MTNGFEGKFLFEGFFLTASAVDIKAESREHCG
jgi:hypothetical protein